MKSLLELFLSYGVVATINESFEKELKAKRIKYTKQKLDDILIFRLEK